MKIFISLFMSSIICFSGLTEELSTSSIIEYTKSEVDSFNYSDTNDFIAKKKIRKARKKRRRKRRRVESKFNRANVFYSEVSLGLINHGTSDENEFEEQINESVINFTTEDSSTGFGVLFGYRWKKWLAFEGSYNILGTETINFTRLTDSEIVQVERSFSTLDFSGKYMYWIGKNENLNLYGLGGLSFWSLSYQLSSSIAANARDESATGTTFHAGFGSEYYFSPKVYAGIGFKLYSGIGNDDLGSQSHTKILASVGYIF
jgi:opacity protein-like surface antigen